jgi:hypothetical protein
VVSSQWSLVIGHWSLVTGHWSLVIGHWFTVTDNCTGEAFGELFFAMIDNLSSKCFAPTDNQQLTTDNEQFPKLAKPPFSGLLPRFALVG